MGNTPKKNRQAVVINPDLVAPEGSVLPSTAEVVGAVYSMQKDAPAAAPVIVEANGAPAAVAPEGPAPDVSSTLTESDKHDDSPAAAVVAAAAQNDAPLAVPAPVDPNAPTADQIVAFKADVQALWIKFFGQRPNAAEAPAFEMPDDEKIEELAHEYRAAQLALDPPVKISLVGAINYVQADLALQAKAADEARKNTAPIADLWLAAGHDVLGNIAATLKDQISRKTRTPRSTTSESGEVKTRTSTGRSGIDWAAHAPALLKFAKDNRLPGLFFVDTSKKGYMNKPHALQLHADGRWEIMNYTGEYTVPTKAAGAMVESPLYFNNAGDSLAEHGGELPNTGGPMRHFYVLLSDGKGVVTVKDADGGIVNQTTGKDPIVIKPVADVRDVFRALGLPTGR